jgi:hypothetical protein
VAVRDRLGLRLKDARTYGEEESALIVVPPAADAVGAAVDAVGSHCEGLWVSRKTGRGVSDWLRKIE